MKFFIILMPLTVMHALSFSQSAWQRIDSLLSATYKPGEPGASIAIQVKGKIVFQKGYGIANMQTGQKNDAATHFNIGSLTKQFTAFAILQLEAQKKLSLSDKLTKYFPDFNKTTGNVITIRQLLTHSSGLTDHYAYVDTHQVKHAVNSDVLAAVKHIDSTYFIPGTRFRYSNSAYCLLGMIIEKVSGLSYPEYIRQHIFTSLHMQDAQVFQMGKQIAGRAIGYDTADGRFIKLDAEESVFFSTEADGGLYLSIPDYLKWYNALQGSVPQDKSLSDKARSPQFPVDKGKKLYYGYGWFVDDSHAARIVYHTGSNGGFRSIVFSIPKKDYLVVLFSNRSGVDLENLVEKINDILGVAGKSYTKIDSLESFNNSCPIFAPWKEITWYSTSFKKSFNASVMALN